MECIDQAKKNASSPSSLLAGDARSTAPTSASPVPLLKSLLRRRRREPPGKAGAMPAATALLYLLVVPAARGSAGGGGVLLNVDLVRGVRWCGAAEAASPGGRQRR
jgi:hypothetical protein